MLDVYLRPLEVGDAKVSFKWRNDPEVWKYTGSKPDRTVTVEIEQEWIKQKLLKTDEKRFAVCLTETNEYIGNVQLTSLEKNKAEFHIFLGEKKYWGKGLGQKATLLMLKIGFNQLYLKEIYLWVKKENTSAIHVYEKCGFIFQESVNNNVLMISKNPSLK